MNAAHINISRYARISLPLAGGAARSFIAAFLTMILFSCTHYEEKGIDSRGLSADLQRADSLVSVHDYPEAMRSLKAFASVQNPPTRDSAMLVKAYTMMAEIHSKYEDYSCEQTFLEAAQQLLPPSSPLLPSIYTRLVDCSCRLNDKAGTMTFHSKQKTETDTASPSAHFYMTISDGIFDLEYRSEEQGILKLRDALTLSGKLKIKDSERSALLLHIAGAYLKKQQPDSALRYIRMLEKDDNMLDHFQRREMLQKAASAFSLKGDSVNAALYTRQWIVHDDSLNNCMEFLSVNSTLNNEHAHRRHAVIDLLNSNIGLWKGVLTALIVLVLAAMAIRYLRTRRVKKHYAPPVHEQSAVIDTDTKRNELLDDIYTRILAEVSKPENYTRPDYNLNLLAAEVGVNVSYVSKAINVNGGKNFRALLNEYRIREACQRLSDTERYGHLTLQAIAEGVGFVSASSFIRAFKQVTGTTPSNYKKTGEAATPANT